MTHDEAPDGREAVSPPEDGGARRPEAEAPGPTEGGPTGPRRDEDAPQPPAATTASNTPTATPNTPTAASNTPTATSNTPGEGEAGLRRGRMSFQDPATTTPRPPSLAEQRARRVAAERARAAEEAEQAALERKHKIRKRALIGGGVAVGLVALVAIGYAAAGPSSTTAHCVDDNNAVVDESFCNTSHLTPYYGGGGGFYPIFIGSGGRQYHYYYGGTGTIGSVARGGTTVAPKTGSITTPSGRSISRGGFGVSGGGAKSSGS